jgi:HPt (histidine-containing phosphotransfer) domain-containing protein
LNTNDTDNSGAANAVDFSQLQSACDGDAGVMRELVDLYFQQADDIIAHMDKAITANDIADVAHLAHKLAGSSLACGMSSVVPSLRKLEGNAKAGHLSGARELFADVTARMPLLRSRAQECLAQYSATRKD